MGKVEWSMKRRIRLLLSVIIADGAIFGMALGIMHTGTMGLTAPQAVQADSGREGTAGQGESARREETAGRGETAGQAEDNGREKNPRQAEQRYVALTFDDGPSSENTGTLLDGLKARGVHATFFLMGENIEGNEELVRRMKADGHLIGNHSYRHVQLTREGTEAVCREIEKTSEMIDEITGEKPEYIRPPYGDWSEELAECVELTPVLWSVDSLDWKLLNTERITRRVLKSVKNGDVILMHDIFPTSVKAALEIVDSLTAAGWQFVTVDELIVD